MSGVNKKTRAMQSRRAVQLEADLMVLESRSDAEIRSAVHYEFEHAERDLLKAIGTSLDRPDLSRDVTDHR